MAITTAKLRFIIWLAVLLAVGLPGAVGAPAQSTGALLIPQVDADASNLAVNVICRAEGDERVIVGRMLLLDSEEIYIRSASASSIFKAVRYWRGRTRSLTFRVGEHSFDLTADSRLVLYDDREVLLPVPALAIDGDLWLPIEFLVRVLGPTIRETVYFNPVDRVLTIGSAEFNISRLRLENLSQATAAHIYCEQQLSYRAEASSNGTVVVKIYGGEADPDRLRAGRSGLIHGVSCRQFSDHVKVYLRVDDLVNRFRTYTRLEGREIVIVVEEEQFTSLPEPTPRGRVNVRFEDDVPLNVTHDIDVRTVIIDPGHGGANIGAVGRGGLLEKDVNLAVAVEVAEVLRERGFEAVLTRVDDTHVGLVERAEKANRSGGDLFLSLHCNGFFNDVARGIETYFLSPAQCDWSESVALAENASFDDTDVSFIVWDLVQNQFISSSSDLAEVVQESLCGALGANDRGVRQAGFRVLTGAYMPAVLVEMGFLSNPSEERRLGDSTYQHRLAEALADAVETYRQRHSRGGADNEGEE